MIGSALTETLRDPALIVCWIAAAGILFFVFLFTRSRGSEDARPELQELGKIYQERSEMARRRGLPRQWITCPICGAQEWVIPPHIGESCPISAQVAEQLGLKLDSERMAAVRMGVSIEEATRRLREQQDQGENE